MIREIPPIPHGSLRRAGYVYFLLASENVERPMIKIGFSLRAPQNRLAACQSGSPVKLELVALLPGAIASKERQLHRQFEAQRSHGEWFYFEGELRAFVEGLF